MLEHLFGSQTRVKLLSLFLRQPDEPIFVREVTRRVGTQINAVRRELANLVGLGLLLEADGPKLAALSGRKHAGVKRKYYKVNTSFTLLPEITALVIKSQVLLERKLDRAIAKAGDVRYLAYLGKFLGPTSGPVDLLVVGALEAKALGAIIADTERDLGFDINFSLMTQEEFSYRKDIADRFLQSVLDAPKNVVIDRLNERVAA